MLITKEAPVLPIADESAASVMARLPIIAVPAIYDDKDKFYSYKLESLYSIIRYLDIQGDIAQFGVYKGRCAQFLLGMLSKHRHLHLFDSFEGLPEDWVGAFRAGAFKLAEQEVPLFAEQNVTVHRGWFNATVPLFAKTLNQPLSFLHIDCDLYSSTRDVLWPLEPHIVPGTVLLFDEYRMDSEGQSDDGEHRALQHWAKEFHRSFEYLWRTRWMQVAVRIVR